MKYCSLLAASVLFVSYANGASACTPFEASNFFELGSADLVDDFRINQTKAIVQRMYDISRRGDTRCSKIVVAGYLEDAEARLSPHLDSSRAKQMVNFLVRELGIPSDRIEAVGAGMKRYIGDISV